MLPPVCGVFQNPPYGDEREYNEGYQVTHVATTTLCHHGVDPSQSASEETASIEHLPLHSVYQVVLTSHLRVRDKGNTVLLLKTTAQPI